MGTPAAAIALYYNPPGCLRVLDPEIDGFNLSIPVLMRESARLSNLERIVNAQQAVLPGNILEPGDKDSWCVFFEEAALAAQSGDWERVTQPGGESL